MTTTMTMDFSLMDADRKTFESKCIHTHIRFYFERGIQIETRTYENGATCVIERQMDSNSDSKDAHMLSILQNLQI